jgi:non-ribosomal peptide synthetase component F
MNKPGLAFVSTSRHTHFWTLVWVLLYGHVVHISSCSLVLVSWHKRIATVGDFYTKNAMQ